MVLANFAEVKHIEGEIFAKIQAYLGRNWVFFSHLGSIFRPETPFSICFKKKTCRQDSNYKNIKLINSDILKYDLEKIINKNSVIFGNLPYNISSQILVKILKFKKWPPNFCNLIFIFN